MITVRKATPEEKQEDYGVRYTVVVAGKYRYGCSSKKQINEVLLISREHLKITSSSMSNKGELSIKLTGVNWQLD